jgi:Asp-tRNA(Asn)/Glu-tRNA(Gln) amidotransferase C subunit
VSEPAPDTDLGVDSQLVARVEALTEQRDELIDMIDQLAKALTEQREELIDTIEQLEADAREREARYGTELAAFAEHAEHAGNESDESVIQHALVRYIVRVQSALDARSRQLNDLTSSRWYRIARSTWRARRRRPPLGALALVAVALSTLAVCSVAASSAATVVAGVLGAAILVTVAIAYTILIGTVRNRSVPPLAGSVELEGMRADELLIVEQMLSEADADPDQYQAPTASIAPPPPVGRRHHHGDPGSAGTALRVAGLLGDSLHRLLAPECQLSRLDLGGWREQLQGESPQLLLVEPRFAFSARTRSADDNGETLATLLSFCRERRIPTAAWNTEGPLGPERSAQLAGLFDHVFTVDAEGVERYRVTTGELSPGVPLPLAAQPRLHNPIAFRDERRSEPLFVGSLPTTPTERAALEAVLDAARPYGLAMYEYGGDDDDDGSIIPDRFRPHLRGRVEDDALVELYKRHEVAVVAGSAAGAEAVVPRGIWELTACGTAVLATPAGGISQTFGELVPTAGNEQEAAALLKRLVTDETYRRALSVRARQLVLSDHTYAIRLARIASTADLPAVDTGLPAIAALALIDDLSQRDSIEDVMLAQDRAAEEIVVGVIGDLAGQPLARTLEQFGSDRVHVIAQPAEMPRSQRWRELAGRSAATWVAPIFAGTPYPPHHLRDVAACTAFADASVIFSPAERRDEHRYVQGGDPRYALCERALVSDLGWAEAADEQRQWFASGVRFYAGDCRP